MLIQRIASALKIRPNEGRLVVLVAALFLCIQAGQGIGENAASALFFLRFGVDFLPYMYMALGGMTFIITLAYAAGLGRFERGRYFLSLMAGFAALLLLERAAIFLSQPVLYPILWLTINCLSMILGTMLWNVTGEVCDARQAKRLFSLFASAGILGSVLGNSITGLSAKALGTDNLLILYALLLGLAFFLTRAIKQGYLRPATSQNNSPNLLGDLRAGFDFVRSSPLLRLIAYASVLFSILFFAVAFPFSKVASASFPDEADVAGFLGLFSSFTTAATFIVSLLIANRLYARIGIVNSALLLPLTYIFGFVFFAFFYNLPGAVTARFLQLVVLSGVAGTAWNALFNVVPSQKRGQVLAFNNGVPSQIGVALSGVLLILGEKVLTARQIFLIGIPVALTCAYLVWRMRAAYGQALIAALHAGLAEVFSSEQPAFARLVVDPLAVRTAIQALQDERATTRRLAAEILARMRTEAAIPALIERLSDPEGSVRAAAIQALGDLKARRAIELILARLDDPQPEVREKALAVLTDLEPDPLPNLLAKLKGLLRDSHLPVRTQAAVMLAKLGLEEPALASLQELLGDLDPELRRASLEALGRVILILDHKSEGSKYIQPILDALQDPSAAVRRSACQTLTHIDGEGVLASLAERLYDPNITVRQACAEALRGHGAAVRRHIFQALESQDEKAQGAALEALPAADAEAFEMLLAYAVREIAQARSLHDQAAGLPPNGRATALLRATLNRRAARCEERLVRVVGLVSDPRAMELVRKSLHGGRAEVRAAAVEALETLGDKRLTQEIIPLLEEGPDHKASGNRPPGAAEVIETLLSSHDKWLSALAARAAPEFNLDQCIPRLRELESSGERLVQQAARDALAQFDEVTPMETLQTVSSLERILLLREVPMFAELVPEDLEQIAEIASEQLYPDGTVIAREGEEGNALFIIVSGQVQVVKGSSGSERVIALRGAGEFVGEMAIIESSPRSASLRAQGEVRVLMIEGEAFKSMLRERVEVSLAVLQGVCRRLRELTK